MARIAVCGETILLAKNTKPMLFDEPRGAVGTDTAAKEWQARTLRSLGIGECLVGLGLALVGIETIGDEALVGLLGLGAGAGALWLGYTDLSASRRFFHPDSLLSDDRSEQERLAGAGHPGRPAVGVAMRVKF